MPTKRDLSELLMQYMGENNMHCMEGTRGVKSFEKLCRALNYSDSFSTSAIHAFLEDNSGCLEAMIEWIGSRNNQEWKEAIKEQLMDPMEEEAD